MLREPSDVTPRKLVRTRRNAYVPGTNKVLGILTSLLMALLVLYRVSSCDWMLLTEVVSDPVTAHVTALHARPPLPTDPVGSIVMLSQAPMAVGLLSETVGLTGLLGAWISTLLFFEYWVQITPSGQMGRMTFFLRFIASPMFAFDSAVVKNATYMYRHHKSVEIIVKK
jgi:hypothetical protein